MYRHSPPGGKVRGPSLTVERIRMWSPGAGVSGSFDIFHVFDKRRPSVLLAKTRSLRRAEDMVAGRAPLASDPEPAEQAPCPAA